MSTYPLLDEIYDNLLKLYPATMRNLRECRIETIKTELVMRMMLDAGEGSHPRPSVKDVHLLSCISKWYKDRVSIEVKADTAYSLPIYIPVSALSTPTFINLPVRVKHEKSNLEFITTLLTDENNGLILETVKIINKNRMKFFSLPLKHYSYKDCIESTASDLVKAMSGSGFAPYDDLIWEVKSEIEAITNLYLTGAAFLKNKELEYIKSKKEFTLGNKDIEIIDLI